MATTLFRYEAELDNGVLQKMAEYFGWEAKIKDTKDPNKLIKNPVSYQEFACVNVLSMNFVAMTVNRVCEPKRPTTLPIDYPKLLDDTKGEILLKTEVYINDKIVLPKK